MQLIRGGQKPPRSSNLELYRIVCMLLIVAHHYVVNSGIMECTYRDPMSARSLFYFLFGMWGKTGINCFVMITGYFMCKSRITAQKFLKLLLEVLFYNIVIYAIFLVTGYCKISLVDLFHCLWPIGSVSTGFTSCFLLFYLTIPFLNILIQNLDKRMHQLLLALSLGIYTILGTAPFINVTFNYVTWFAVIYFIASYIRMYPEKWFDNNKVWGWATIASIAFAMASVVLYIWGSDRFGQHAVNCWKCFYFVSDSNKFFAVTTAVCSFMWFKNLKIKQSKFINTIAASTFGVLLIHANSDTMRSWLWKDVLNVAGQYGEGWGPALLHAFGSVAAIFAICIAIDRLRIEFIEKPLLASKLFNGNNG